MKILFYLISFLLFVGTVQAAPIIVRTQPSPVKDQQWVFLNIDVDGKTYEYTYFAPLNLTGNDLDQYIKKREKDFELWILMDQYPGCPEFKNLNKMRKWIDDGHMVNGEVVPKKEPEYKHPPWVKLRQDFEAASTVDEKLEVIIKYLEN